MIEKWVYNFSKNTAEGNSNMKETLGGKGANLAEMCNIGLNVPPGFTIITQACNEYFNNDYIISESIRSQVKNSIKIIESSINSRFGGKDNPLLLSIRSGSRSSMPGMMDTILNLGLNESNVEALAKKTNNPRFVYDSYRRFIQMYSNVVLELEHNNFEEILEIKKQQLGIELDTDLKAEDLKDVIKLYKEEIYKISKKEFPENLEEQLWNSIGAVFKSWKNQRAVVYRKIHNIPQNWGTAVNIQAMVFGNTGENSATGVAFTRDPSNGQKKFFGEYLTNAQGEDVVAGIRTPRFITKEDKEANYSTEPSMEEAMPDLYRELREVALKLERHYSDMQDIEFTIQDGKLWILQTRSGKRTAKAAINIAVDMVKEGILTKAQAISRIEPNSLDQLLHPTLDYSYNYNVIAKGLPASPGAASGVVVFNPEAAAIKAANNQKTILVRIETSPEDISGMYAAAGILTSRGGMTSHAAVVARGMGKACVCGANDIVINYREKIISVGKIQIKEGDLITINGSTGEVILGEVPTIDPELSEEFETLLIWADECSKIKVRANAETYHDTCIAVKFKAEGIGLCRTEHMFFNDERINAFRMMILSKDIQKRNEALSKLMPMQKNDFLEIFKLMNNLPVNIRLLDPPLHEFLPHKQQDIQNLADALNLSIELITQRIEELKEQNPMLGHRGCRIGVSYPEIYEMQVEAILSAMKEAIDVGIDPRVEIMIPFVISLKELEIIKDLIKKIADKIKNNSGYDIEYKLGTMIELPKAALMAGVIAKEADFFSFGTNDLTQTTLGISRDDASSFLQTYHDNKIFEVDPFTDIDQEAVGELIGIAIERARRTKPDIKIGICGEQAGNPSSIQFLSKFNLDYISCSPYRIAIAKLAAAQVEVNNLNFR